MFKNKFAFKTTTLVVVSMLVSSILAVALLMSVVKKDFTKIVDETVFSQVNASAKSINTWLDVYKNYLNLLSHQKKLTAHLSNDDNNTKAIINLLKSFDTNYIPAVTRIVVFNKSGKMISFNPIDKTINIGYSPNFPEFHAIMLDKKDTYSSEIVKGPITGAPVQIMAKAIKNEQGENIGLISFGCNIEKFKEHNNTYDIANSAFTWGLDGDKKIIFHPDFKKNIKIDSTNEVSPVIQSAKFSLNSSSPVNHFSLNGKKYTSVYAKIPNGQNWIYGTTFETNNMYQPVNRVIKTYTFWAAISIFSALVITTIVSLKLLAPIKNILYAMQNIASAEADLTKRIEIKLKKDELSELTQETNKFIENLNDLLSKILKEANIVSENVKNVSEATKDIFNQSEKTNSGIFDISSAMREMVATSEEISSNTENAATQVKSANNEANAGITKLKEVIDTIQTQAKSIVLATEDIKMLQEDGKRITAVMEVINGIAEQTNLLALNAAIEAARAGESGKGFAVVADEVRSLAQKTHESTSEIQNTIAALNSSINSAAQAMAQSNEQAKISVESANKTENVLNKIDDSMEKVEGMNLQIASATQQQTTTANELSKVLEKIAEFSQKTQDELQLVVNSTNELEESSSKLKNLLNRFIIG